MVQLSWQGASRKHSLTLSLTPKPASSESPASPSLSYHTAHQLGIRQCSKRPGPCGVGTQRRSCPGQRRERGELHDWGRGAGEPSPWAPCSCILSPFPPFPAPLRALTCSLPSQESPFSSPSLQPAASVQLACGKARLSVTRAVTWEIGGQSQVPFSSLLLHLPHPTSV